MDIQHMQPESNVETVKPELHIRAVLEELIAMGGIMNKAASNHPTTLRC